MTAVSKSLGVFAVLAAGLLLSVLMLGWASVDALGLDQGLIVSDDPVDFTPNVQNGHVNAITTVGDLVVVGGTFTQVKEVGDPTAYTRNYLFAFDRTTGDLSTTFTPALDGAVETLDVAADGASVLVGGVFANVNGNPNFGLAKLDVATGAQVPGFNATTAGKVRDLEVHNGKVYLAGDIWSVNGVQRTRMAVVDEITGALDPTFDVETTLPRVSVDWVSKLDVSPDGTQMAIMGNFLEVDNLPRKQIAVIDLSGPVATVADWSTDQFAPACSGSFWTYMRDIEFSPDGDYFAVATTGGPFTGTLCDTATRWESDETGSGVLETWSDWSGGDTLTAVAVSDVAVYIGGHQRWMNNHLGKDNAKDGAVVREGIVALDPINGVPYAWNPGKARGVAVYDLHLSDLGLYVGSDTDFAAGEYHAKLAQFPLAGGSTIPLVIPETLPTNLYSADTSGPLMVRSYSGTTFGTDAPVAGDVLDWGLADGAFHEAGSVWFETSGELRSRTFDGSTMGPEVVQPSWVDWSSVDAMAWDGGRLYYTTSGSDELRYQYLSLESGIVGSQVFTISGNGDGLDWADVVGLGFVAGDLYFAETNGNLSRISMNGGVPVPGTQAVVSGPGIDGRDWDVEALFFYSADTAPSVTVTAPLDGGTISGAAAVLTADATDAEGISEVEFFVDGGSIGVDSNGGNGWSVTWDSTTVADGPVSVSATATDTAGQTATDTVAATVDNLGPTVVVTAPADGATVSNVVALAANATDDVGVAQVEFFAGAASVGIDTDGTDGWSVAWDSRTVADGSVQITATATDLAGQPDSDAISVTVDNSAGAAVVMVVGNGASPSAADLVVRDRFESLGFAVSFVDDGALTTSDADGASLVLVASTANSNLVGSKLYGVAQPVWVAKPYSLDNMGMTDTAGGVDYGTTSGNTVVIVDSLHPLAGGLSGNVAVTTSNRSMSWGIPAPSSSVVVTVSGLPTTFVYEAGETLADGSAAAGCRLTMSVFQTAPLSFTADGWALFDAAALYAANNCDPLPADDLPTVTITSPADGATVSGTIQVSADASDTEGVVQVEFVADGVSLGVDTNGANGWSASWDTAAGRDGTLSLEAIVTDTGAQTATDSISVAVDNGTAPVVVMVVGNGSSPATGDVAVIDRLASLGYSVAVLDDSDATPGSAAGASFVVIASTVNSNAVGSTFYGIAQPVWVAKPWSLDDMGMTGTAGNTDYGTVGGSTTITIVDGAHPLAAGYTGTVQVTSSNRKFLWGVPAAAADVVASINGSPTTFVYQGGDTLADGSSAAGCRLTSSIFQSAPVVFTADGWALFDAAAAYAANGCE